MKGFRGDVTLKRLNETTYQLVGDLTYSNDELKVIAKHGMPTDGASTPRFLWWYASPFTGAYQRASIIHDVLYQSEAFTRKQADELFKEIMIADGVRETKALLMYYAVRLGGYFVWASHTADSIVEARRYLWMS